MLDIARQTQRFEQTWRGGNVQRETSDERSASQQPESEPGALETRVAGDQNAAALEEA